MAPYFLRNLVPRREARDENRPPLLQVLRSITWVQWAQFFSGYVPLSPQATSQANFYLKMACLDLRRARLFQRVPQRYPPPKAIQQRQGFYHCEFYLHQLSYSPLEADCSRTFLDTGHHVDASVPIHRRCKCFFITRLTHTCAPISGIYDSSRSRVSHRRLTTPLALPLPTHRFQDDTHCLPLP